MKPALLVDDTANVLAHMLDRFVELAEAAQASRDQFCVAVPGGSVAESFFPQLVSAAIDWRRTHVFWVDERCVPPSDPESNYGRARDLWLAPLRLEDRQVHSMAGAAPDLGAAAAAAEHEMIAILGDPPRADLALLGVGPDGHVASLFPGRPELIERRRYIRGVDDAPKPPPRRLTWTLPALAGSRELWVVAFGDTKAAPVHAALAGLARTTAGPGTSPLELAIRSGPPCRVFLDTAAGSGLRDANHRLELPPPGRYD